MGPSFEKNNWIRLWLQQPTRDASERQCLIPALFRALELFAFFRGLCFELKPAIVPRTIILLSFF